jgi:hypothetical protein
MKRVLIMLEKVYLAVAIWFEHNVHFFRILWNCVPTSKKRDVIAAAVLFRAASNNDPPYWAPLLSYTSSHIASDLLP